MESMEQTGEQFKFPNLEEEIGEFERVSKYFNLKVNDLLDVAEIGEMVMFDGDIETQLTNSDVNDIEIGDWEKVDNLCKQAKRQWRDYRTDLEAGRAILSPIILKYKGIYHLVSGNTRLMVSKALGVRPKVLLFEIG